MSPEVRAKLTERRRKAPGGAPLLSGASRPKAARTEKAAGGTQIALLRREAFGATQMWATPESQRSPDPIEWTQESPQSTRAQPPKAAAETGPQSTRLRQLLTFFQPPMSEAYRFNLQLKVLFDAASFLPASEAVKVKTLATSHNSYWKAQLRERLDILMAEAIGAQ